MHICLPAETQSALSRSHKLAAQIAGHSRSAAVALLAPYFALHLASVHLSLSATHVLLARVYSVTPSHAFDMFALFAFCVSFLLSSVFRLRLSVVLVSARVSFEFENWNACGKPEHR